MGAQVKELSLPQLANGRLKALKNAEDLLADAKILYDSGRWARTLFLARIAIEELGKYVMIVSAVVEYLRGRVNWIKFWKRFTSHREKTGNVLTLDMLLGPTELTSASTEKLEAIGKKMSEEKLASLYLDFKTDAFVCPLEAVTETAARHAIEEAEAVLSVFQFNERVVFSKGNIEEISRERWAAIEAKLVDSLGGSMDDK